MNLMRKNIFSNIKRVTPPSLQISLSYKKEKKLKNEAIKYQRRQNWKSEHESSTYNNRSTDVGGYQIL